MWTTRFSVFSVYIYKLKGVRRWNRDYDLFVITHPFFICHRSSIFLISVSPLSSFYKSNNCFDCISVLITFNIYVPRSISDPVTKYRCICSRVIVTSVISWQVHILHDRIVINNTWLVKVLPKSIKESNPKRRGNPSLYFYSVYCNGIGISPPVFFQFMKSFS